MPDLFHMLILAAIQGLTEFLPVSSSGHLVLTQHFLASMQGDVFFDIVLHVGTLGSIFFVYWRDFRRLLKLDQLARTYLLSLGLATLPAVVVGLLGQEMVMGLFHSPRFAASGLLFTSVLLFVTRFAAQSPPLPEPWEPKAPSLKQATLIGLAQSLAILPGISRSGATIATALMTGLPRAESARFSFMLSVPAVSGALVLSLIKGVGGGRNDLAELWLGALVAFLVGLVAIRWTALAVVQAHFWKFSFYCFAAGLGAFIFLD